MSECLCVDGFLCALLDVVASWYRHSSKKILCPALFLGYPTIKYFVDGDKKGEDYKGGRDYESLKSFVEEKLEVPCDPLNPSDACTDKEKGYIEKMKGKTKEEREAQIKRLEGMQGDSMKADLKKWLMQRMRILKGLNAAAGDEL